MAIELLTLDTVQNKLRSVQAGDVINVPATLNVNALNVGGVPITGGVPQHTHVSADITDAVGPAGGKLLRTNAAGKVALANLPNIPPNQLADANGVIPAANFNAAGGIPLLDAAGKIPVALLPALQSGLRFLGAWQLFPNVWANPGSPTLPAPIVTTGGGIASYSFVNYQTYTRSVGGGATNLGYANTTPTTISHVVTVAPNSTTVLLVFLSCNMSANASSPVPGLNATRYYWCAAKVYLSFFVNAPAGTTVQLLTPMSTSSGGTATNGLPTNTSVFTLPVTASNAYDNGASYNAMSWYSAQAFASISASPAVIRITNASNQAVSVSFGLSLYARAGVQGNGIPGAPSTISFNATCDMNTVIALG